MSENTTIDFIKENKCPNYPYQEYMWFAEYEDGTKLYEMDNNCIETQFSEIDRDKLKTFGLIGKGQKIWFNINDGIIHLNENEELIFNILKEISYEKDSDKVTADTIKIMDREDTKYNDIIQYKKASLDIGMNGETRDKKMYVEINFIGFKVKIKDNDNIWNIQLILCVPRVNNNLFSYLLKTRINSMKKDDNVVLELKIKNNTESSSLSPVIEFKKDTPQEFMIRI